MNRKSIPIEIRRNIIFKSGGRCQLCNKNLSVHGLTQLESNEREFAHIFAASEDGLRGDEVLSPRYIIDESNILLLCPSCHKLYDDKRYLDIENVFYLPSHEADSLKKRKAEQEKEVQRVLDTLDKPRTQIIKYTARIHSDPIPPSSYRELNHALVYDELFPLADIVDLSHVNAFGDNNKDFWNDEIRQLEGALNNKLRPLIDAGAIQKMAVFAVAPMPLLMKLGTLLRDYADTVVFQKKKEPNNWIWEPNPVDYSFVITEPDDENDAIAVNLSLSDDIYEDRIHRVLGNKISIWKLSHANPSNDFIRSKAQLEALRRAFRELYSRILRMHGNTKIIHVFPAMPVSAAVEFGRVRNSKSNNPLRIYDENKNKGGSFEYAIDID